ncbi:MAG: hypothetical protein ACXWHG_15120 [Thermoanaerobaculia bacterium]
MVRVTIYSRTGNRVLAVAGVLYAIAGISLFGWYVVDTWNAASMIDRALQMVLIGAIVTGAWFIYVAKVNLTEDLMSRQPARQNRARAEALS